MKVNFLHVNPVNLRFGFGKACENRDCATLDFFIKSRIVNDFFDGVKMPVRVFVRHFDLGVKRRDARFVSTGKFDLEIAYIEPLELLD